MKWDYFTAYCWYEDKCKQHRDEKGKERAHWGLDLYDSNGKHYFLTEGLKILGEQGWELVAVQPHRAGSSGVSFIPDFFYVFKKPK